MKRLFSATLLLGYLVSAQPLFLYVAKQGDNKNLGSKDAPFASLERARDKIRELKKAGTLPKEGVVVEVSAGIYERQNAFELGKEDSGTAATPIVYRAAPDVSVRISGGRALSGFVPLQDKALNARLPNEAVGKVFVLDLKKAGITEYGEPRGGFSISNGKFSELFFADKAMQIARWPNDEMVKIVEVLGATEKNVRGTKGCKEGVFRYADARAKRWIGEADLWIHGWWFWDWADQRQPVESIDPENKIITIGGKPHRFGYRPGMWYYIFNALSELDQPGEWCLDRLAGKLYFWPPLPLDQKPAVLSQSETLVKLQDVEHVTLQGFTFEHSRTTPIVVRNGENCRILGCTVRNNGGAGISISGGNHHQVKDCDIYATGDGGIGIGGGNRKTLTPCNHVAENNHIHHYARWNRILRCGVNFNGVGIRIANNLIHDAPHKAIIFSGNDNMIEYNEIHSVCFESNDAGAIYAGRDWTQRGNTIRYNYLHHISGFEGRGCVGVYLDDMWSSAHIYGNVFYDVTRATFIGGGRDTIIENNIFVDCKPAVHIDDRALGWAKGSVAPGGTMRTRLAAMPYKGELWSKRYPKLVGILDDEPAKPKGNIVRRNICWGGRWDEVQKVARKETLWQDNFVELGLGHSEPTFHLRPDHPAWKVGFKEIPFGKIGLKPSPTRASWPPIHTPRLRGFRGEKTGGVKEAKTAKKSTGVEFHHPPALVGKPPVIDGETTPGEWQNLDPSRAIILAQNEYGKPVSPRSTAWIFAGKDAFYVLVDNAITARKAPNAVNKWGQGEAVELSFRSNLKAPILVLRGYLGGACKSSTEAGATEAQATAALSDVEYACKQLNPGRWVTEWKIPFKSLNLAPTPGKQLDFSIAVRKTGSALWLMWNGVGKPTWSAPDVGRLVLP